MQLKKNWQLFWHFRRIELMRMMEYRGDFIFWAVVSVMWTIFNFLFFTLLFTVTDVIAGWTQMEMYAFLAIYSMVDALTWSFFAQNMWEYRRSIYDGSLSSLLLKPADTITLLLIKRNSYNNLPRFLIGLVVLVWALNNLGITPSTGQILLFIAFFFALVVFLYTGWFFTTTWAFWTERLDNITEIMPTFRTLYEYPKQIYTGVAAKVLIHLFPVALVITTPAEILLGTFNWQDVGYFFVFTAGFVVIAQQFFRVSVRKYGSVGG